MVFETFILSKAFILFFYLYLSFWNSKVGKDIGCNRYLQIQFCCCNVKYGFVEKKVKK
tara:strand:- start:99849 stop:100022 length:174 start_codon:yes stop_codon:yes gene_type:complete